MSRKNHRKSHMAAYHKSLQPKITRQCTVCNTTFNPKSDNHYYCSTNCSVSNRVEPSGLSNGTTGAIAELRVCSDLLSQGYAVYRSVSPTAPCDLVALKDGEVRKIEVRTAGGNRVDGSLYYPTKRAALVTEFAIYDPRDGSITYTSVY